MAMNAKEFFEALEQLEAERGIRKEDVIEALKVAMESEEGLSISMLQRRLGYGWPRAAKAFDKAIQLGIFGPKDNKSRVKLTVSNGPEEIP